MTMSNFVTTNIRISEEDYLRLKEEAAKKRQSLSAVIRGKIATQTKDRSEDEKNQLYKRRLKVAGILNSKLKDFDIVKALREMRYEGKW